MMLKEAVEGENPRLRDYGDVLYWFHFGSFLDLLVALINEDSLSSVWM